jgi:DNA-binding LacI/PurR family transcriptional regulator
MITLRDIAARAFVSQTTVSKVLNGKHREFGITSDCADRVKAIADQLGYRPNRAARATASGRFNTIGILKVNGPVGLGQLPDGLLNGVEAGAEKMGLQLSFSSVSPDFSVLGKLPKVLHEAWADGFLLFGDWDPTPQLAAKVREMMLPLVTVGIREDHDSIYADEADACRRAVECLLAAGHRRIGHVPDEHLPLDARSARRHAFAQTVTAAGLPDVVVNLPAERRRVEVRPWLERAQARREFLSASDRPTALVVDSVELAYPLLAEARAMGVRIPQDLALITFHDVVASALGICIDTMVLRYGDIGRKAVHLLQSRIDSGKPQSSMIVRYEYLGGHTVS